MPAELAQTLLQAAKEGAQQLEGHFFLMSSGTTARGIPDLKWVALSHQAVLNSAQAVNDHLEAVAKDRWLHALPDFHVGGLGIWARSFLSGAKVVAVESQSGKWSAPLFYASLESEGITLTSLVPAQLYDLVQLKLKSPRTLRAVLLGGGSLSLALYQAALALGWPVLPTYGMTEAASQVATAALSSLSSVLRGGEVARLAPLEEGIVAAAALPPLKILPHLEAEREPSGLLKLVGSSLLSGYIYTDVATGVASFHDPKVDGWLLTQDLVELQAQELKVLGRRGDFIKIGGENVELSRLRGLLEALKVKAGFVGELELIAMPDRRLGHVIFLLGDQWPADRGGESELIRQVINIIKDFNNQVLGFERIRQWHHLNPLPRTAIGKLKVNACVAALNLQSQVMPL